MSYTDTKLIALDPGKTTGVAIAHYRRTHNDMEDKTWRLNLIETEQLDYNVEGIWQWLALQQPSGIIYETFTYRRLPNADLTPVEIIGALKIYALLHGIELWGSIPSNKALWDNDKLLKLSGYHWPAMGRLEFAGTHARDAVRHLLHWSSIYGLRNEMANVTQKWALGELHRARES